MLDNVKQTTTKMLDTCNGTTTVAPALTEEQVKQSEIMTNAPTNASSSPLKTKTLFSWFRSGNTKSTNTTTKITKPNNAESERRVYAATRAKSLSPPAQPTATGNVSGNTTATEREVTLHEFPGVQSLRHLWNKRISASEDATRLQSVLSESEKRKLTKSIGCLVHAATEGGSKAAGADTLAVAGLALRQKRAYSLHDCSQVGADPIPIADLALDGELEIDYLLHLEKDNFYKYKTAEQAAKHLAREPRVRSKSTRRVTAGIVNSETRGDDSHFPAVKASERGERIHWLKREDMMMAKQREIIDMPAVYRETAAASGAVLSADDIVINERTSNVANAPKIAMPKAIETLVITPANTGQEPTRPHTCDADNEAPTASDSPQSSSVSREPNVQRETSNTSSLAKHSNTGTNKRNSSILSASAAFTSNGAHTGERKARRTASSASTTSSTTARKYSFKTHTRTYHAPRKMSQRDCGAASCGVAGGGGNGASGGSIVAKLTQQFNEIIQKDKKLLEEVKRKNGVLMARGGHVYKVVENPLAAPGDGSKRTSPSVSRNESRGKDATAKRPSTVQRNIKKFESGRDVNKPEVPAKSEQVLQRLRELNRAQQSSPSNGCGAGAKRLQLKLPPPTSAHELQVKKAQLTLPLSPPLEVVKEESKTPLEADVISLSMGDKMNAQVPTNGITEKDAENTKKNIEVRNGNSSALSGGNYTHVTINKKRNYESTPMLTSTGTGVLETETKNVGGQILTPKETGKAIGVEATSDESTETESIKTIKECNANIELGIPTNALPAEIGTTSDDERTKTNGIISTQITEPLKSNCIDDHDDQLEDGNDGETKQWKNKYAKIYEKFRFRSPFSGGGHSNKKQQTTAAQATEQSKQPSTELAEDVVKFLEPKRADTLVETLSTPKDASTPTIPQICTSNTNISETQKAMQDHDTSVTVSPYQFIASEPESKLLDALQILDHKLKDLTVEEDNTSELILSTDGDFEQRVMPNNSFVFQASTKQVLNNKLIVAQAVNVALVNEIEGENMMLVQKELQRQHCDYSELVRPLSANMKQPALVELDSNKKSEQSESAEPIYEPIGTHSDPTNTEKCPKEESEATGETLFQAIFASEAVKQVLVNNALVEKCEENANLDDIYQTVEEVTTSAAEPLAPAEAKNSALLADYESIAGSCEHASPATTAVHTNSATGKPLYDGYEICEPPPYPPQTLPGTPLSSMNDKPSRTNSKVLQQISTGGGNVRNTNDELPELPKPKRRLPKSPMPGKRSPKSANQNAALFTKNDTKPTSAEGCSKSSSNSTLTAPGDHDDDHHYYADDENIYDTIKGSHCYESLHGSAVALQTSSSTTRKCRSDSISVTSNCYESISHYNTRRASQSASIGGRGGATGGQLGSSSGSTLTISSDHKTNSLYEMSVTASMIYSMGSVCSRMQLVADKSSDDGGLDVAIGRMSGTNGNTSDGSSGVKNYYQTRAGAASDNSDEWVDISDPEAEGATEMAKPQFIVVRERSKAHRSPDWSKRVRDKRLHQKKAISCIEDDSDHYYETLSPLGNKRHSTLPVQRTNSHYKRYQDLPHFGKNGSQRSQYSASMHGLGTLTTSDDYDSFDTDTDDIYGAEQNTKNTDSGVDIRNVKLPDPPPATNQVYAIVRKLKNFISNKKSPSSHSKYGDSQQKLYENSTQFYVSGTSNIYENTPKTKARAPKNGKKKTMATPQDQDVYENTEFHSPPAIAKDDTTMERTLNSPTDDSKIAADETSNTSATLRSKSKSSKSFKSRLRKSLVGSTFDMKQLSTLAPARSTFYIEDPTYGGSGELDSGFSEKASSGDLPTAPNTLLTVETQKFSTVARKTKKEAKASNTQRRKTTIGLRPQDPPPPPPVPSSTTSWYAECGVFKNGAGTNGELQESEVSLNDSKASQSGSSGMNGSSWYTEAGLYQTSGVSVASSSGSSGVSTGNEGTLGDDLSHSMFQNEPLYQIYSAAKLESITRDLEGHDSSTDGYEEIGQNDVIDEVRMRSQMHQRPSAFQLIEPKNGPSRTLWSEIPEVINSCVLATLTPRERSLQEAKFEIITSEASYLKSLNLLRSHFMNHPIFRDANVVSARDRKALFAYIVPVHECSERLLTEMESCWQDNIMLIGLSKRIYNVAEKYFHVYIAFCEHQGRMDRTLRRLKESHGLFAQNLLLLETSPTCCGLNLHSFLMLPMQRITRLPLLIDAVFSKVSPNDDEYDNWKMTLAIMNKIVTQCNEAANRCEQAYEIERIARQLEFPSKIRALAIAPAGVPAPGSKPRFLVKRGELTHFIWRGDDVKLTFGKKFSKVPIYAFLFSDLLVLTKRKGEEQFTVFDYCPRSMLTISSGDLRDISQTHKNLILMTLLENHERKTVELLLSCTSVSEQERWLQAVRPPEPETPGEKLYAPWDCPQVIAKHAYETREPDALSLEVGDVINVTRKLPDGWYQGERIRDGMVGWFPGSYTEEVNSAHVRARNLKQRQRLLTFTASYLESQKRK